jgi:hypothetical protein
MLARLDATMPELIRSHPADADFWRAFAAASDVILDAAHVNDYEWILERADAILIAHGKQVPDLDAAVSAVA